MSLLALANLIVFPALVRLRRSHPDQPRAFRVPGGPAGALAASALATGWSAVALAASLWPGLGTGDPDAHLPEGFAGQRLAFTLTELLPWPPCSGPRSCSSASAAAATTGPAATERSTMSVQDLQSPRRPGRPSGPSCAAS